LKKVNLAKVRSATGSQYRFGLSPSRAAVLALLALVFTGLIGLGSPPAAGADATTRPQVFIALLPNGTPPQALEQYPRLAPGLLSAGIGEVPAAQTYLDIGQANRVSERLYDETLPGLGTRPLTAQSWREVVDRADGVPADLVPGLLAAALKSGRRTILAATRLGLPALIAADRNGRILRGHTGLGTDRCLATVCVRDVRVGELGPVLARTGPDDLLIAFERPPPSRDELLTIGVAGSGFAGNLTSDSTRLRGYVISTDLAPTILDYLGVREPAEMAGEPIRAEGERDVDDLVSLEDRLSSIVDRRGSVIGISALIWLAVALVAALASRGALGRPAARMSALTGIYLPLMLLAGSAIQSSETVERLVVVLGAPLLAALTLVLARGYRALAVACALTTLAFAIDVIAGSPLTRLSLIGSNPGLGVRFFGIGNELEAMLVPMVLAGTGAALTALWPGLDRRRGAAAFLGVAFLFAFVFAAGRFGADVGAAIVLPAGGAAAALLLGARRRVAILVLAAPLAALVLLSVFDLVLGGDAHLTRSVLDAGGLHELGDVAERRLRLSADSFGRALDVPLLWVAVAGIAVAVVRRERILAWFDGRPFMRAGFLAAAGAVLLATVANDSGALLLEVGTIYVLLIAGFAWAESATPAPPEPPRTGQAAGG
jgi:hypothetical protein